MNTVNPGDGHRGRDEFPRERDDYRGAHRRADEPEEYGDGYADDRYYDTAYADAEYVEAEPVEAELVDEEEERRGALGGSTVATAGAAGAAGAGAAGSRDAAAAGSRDAAAAGLPKRGLGMILLAVGVLLALWAVFALNKGDDSPSNTAEETQSSQASDAAQPNGAGENGANNGAAAPAPGQENAGQNGDAQNPDAQNPDANTPDAQNPGANADANANGDAGEAAPAPANNPATPGLTAQDAQVYVFNNSGVPELANKTAGELGGQYHVANQSQDPAAMNMPEQTFGVFPETYVFYNPQVAGADQVAAEVAQRVGGTPRTNNDLPDGETQLPSEAIQNRNAITVVLAGR
ncbi:LytR C-terminal domain-containing protein [Corynebacterium gottingense]|uniref:LytR C-terminal domain-containing protein n=1 Tax=Corynebacterium gottingense TaxID=2041036 RepID=UPI0038CFB506